MEEENKPVEQPEPQQEVKPIANVDIIEKENARLEAAIAKRQELISKIQLAGSADAGSIYKTPEQQHKEFVEAEIRKRLTG